MSQHQPDPSAVATADQWRAELRELVNRVRLHRLGCPDEGAGYICVGQGIADHINHHLDDDDARGLLITALYEIAGRDADELPQVVVNAARAHAGVLRLVKELRGGRGLTSTAQRLVTAVDMLDAADAIDRRTGDANDGG